MCHLYHVYNNSYNNNNSFVFLICLQPFCKPYLLVILLTRLFAFLLTTILYALLLFIKSSQRRISNRNFTQGWLSYYHCSRLCSICAHFQPTECSQIRMLMISPSRESIATACVCTFSHLSVAFAYCCWFILKMFDVFVSVYFCIVYSLSLVAFAFVVYVLSICFILMIFVLVAFVYCS